MFSRLKNHPFAVEAFFERSLVLTFAVPREQVLAFLPPCLQPDCFEDRWAFIAMAMVQTRGLRPKGFPRFMGQDFFLTGYRVFVTYRNQAGKRLRGLYILRSETDRRSMQFLGNMFTHYNYTTTDIVQRTAGTQLEIQSVHSDFKLVVDLGPQEAALPVRSPFERWDQARRFAGPLPFTFSYLAKSREVLMVEGVRQHWKPRGVNVIDYHIAYIDRLGLEGAVLANAFMIEQVPYYWKKGKAELWKG